MATPINKKQIKSLDKVNYLDFRNELKTGDLVFCSGNYFFSKIIQRLTKSSWSHVGVIYKDEELNRVLVLESEVLIGVRLVPMSKYINDYQCKGKAYKGNLIVASLNVDTDKKELDKAISFGLDELTRPYDNYEIFRIMIRILFKITKHDKNKNYICSELVRDMYQEANLTFKQVDNYISPDDVWADDKVNMKWRFL